MCLSWDDCLDRENEKYFYTDKAQQYRTEAVEKLKKHYPNDIAEAMAECFADSFYNESKGIRLLTEYYGLTDLHMAAFCREDKFEELFKDSMPLDD